VSSGCGASTRPSSFTARSGRSSTCLSRTCRVSTRAYPTTTTSCSASSSAPWVPTATHAVGPECGLYIGRTLSGSCQPVLFDLTEASRTSRPAAVLCSGTLGSGKTLTAQLLAYQAFLAGSRVVSVDPKGDHRLHELAGADHVELVELQPGVEDRGRLDPLRIAPEETRTDLAYAS